ncbi:MAG: XRE family transcriptional regulator [Rubrivivax sp.]|nr:MAG: XRE family transcriptional regulator [Rubrivivax sp.]
MTPSEHPPLQPREPAPFGRLLRQWRALRKRSQLDLALEANVSQRHLSFLESGRAQPSREMALALAEVLDLPWRERNLLLNAAGFAAVFPQRALQTDEMAIVRQGLALTLRHHEPYPAVVVNRHWDMLMSNTPAQRFVGLLGPADELWQRVDPGGGHNVMRLTFHPQGMQARLKNWPTVSALLLSRLQREVAADPTYEPLRQVLADVSGFPGMPSGTALEGWAQAMAPPVFPLEFDLGADTLRVFTMVSTFGTALDITAEELRVETFFPADDFSRDFFRMLAA